MTSRKDGNRLQHIRVWARIWLLRVNLSIKVIFWGTSSISEGRLSKGKICSSSFTAFIGHFLSFDLFSISWTIFGIYRFEKRLPERGFEWKQKKLSSVRTRFRDGSVNNYRDGCLNNYLNWNKVFLGKLYFNWDSYLDNHHDSCLQNHHESVFEH